MDQDEQARLESAKREIEGYLNHPFTKRILQDNLEEQEGFIKLICNEPVTDIQRFFAHFEAVGHLRGLRRAHSLLQDNLDAIQDELKEP